MKIRKVAAGIYDAARWTGGSVRDMTRSAWSRVVPFFRNRPKLVFFPALALGVLVFMAVVTGKSGPVKTGAVERQTVARIITAPQVRLVPRAIGYGYIQPGRNWEAVAEVAGKITEMHPQLREGGIITKGEVLLRIDPAQSELAQAQTDANVRNIEAQILELNQKEADLRRTLATESKSLELSKRDLERYKKLIETGTIARSELDSMEQQFLTKANTVQNYRTQLNQVPAQREALNAQLLANQSKSEDARLTVEKTVLVAPFDCRVAEMNVELGQAVQVGKVLADLDTLGVSEALAQVPLYAFRTLMAGGEDVDAAKFQSFFGLLAKVRVDMAGTEEEWAGSVSRLSDEVDPATRTIGVYVAVDGPHSQGGAGSRTPLVKNMYAEVELRGRPLPYAVVLPRSAVHDGVVHMLGEENRLTMRPVRVGMVQGDVVVIDSGVLPGERVVVGDLVPAIEGMLIIPVEDEALRQAVVDYALGKGSVK